MNRITRYIASHLLIATLFVTLTITCAVWLTQSLRFIELIVNRGLSIGSYLYLTLLLLPSFLAMLLPIGMFASMVFTYNRLTADSELIVLRAAGLGPAQLAKPAWMMSLLVVALGYLLHLLFMPLSYREFKDLEMDFRTDYSAILLREGAFNTVSDGITVYIRAREANGELQGLIVHDNRNKERTVTIMAERGILAQAEEGPRVIMVNGNRQLIDRETGKLSLLYFDRYSVDIGRPGAADQGGPSEARWREPRERFIYELLFPADTPNDRRFYDRLRAEGHNRLTAPLYALAFAMIALATLLSGDHNRRGQARRVILAICLAVAVQSGAVLVSGLAARSSAFLPLIWLNVLVPIVVGVWWLFRVPRRRRPREFVPEPAA
jgi:lipopolysaccharide export system permease protein